MLPESSVRTFMNKFIAQPNGCWKWLGKPDRDGYGEFHSNYLKTKRAHRIAYELLCEPIPQGLVIDHLCLNRKCVNPTHMEIVTNKQNVLRGTGFTAQNAKKTHCLKGHDLSKTGRIYARNMRQCMVCNADRARKYRGENAKLL
jgi:hypothetical protein